MANMRNQVRLIGHLGKDPEVRETATGKKLARFSVATNETYINDKGERVSETQWHNIICWGKTATLAEKVLSKGAEVALEGKISTKQYTDKDGNRKATTEIVATDFLAMGGKKSAAA